MKYVVLYMAFSMVGGGQDWKGEYTPVEYFDTLRECKAVANKYIDRSVNSDLSSVYGKPEGTIYSYRHFRCVPEGGSVDAIGDDDNSLRMPVRPRTR
jgi:hypothetical protein